MKHHTSPPTLAHECLENHVQEPVSQSVEVFRLLGRAGQAEAVVRAVWEAGVELNCIGYGWDELTLDDQKLLIATAEQIFARKS